MTNIYCEWCGALAGEVQDLEKFSESVKRNKGDVRCKKHLKSSRIRGLGIPARIFDFKTGEKKK